MNTSIHTATKCAYLLKKQGKPLLSQYETKAMIVQLVALILTLEESGTILLRQHDPWQRTQMIRTEAHTKWAEFFPEDAMEVVDFIEYWTAKHADHTVLRDALEQELSLHNDALEKYDGTLQHGTETDPYLLALLDSGQCFSALFHAPIQERHRASFETLTEKQHACVDAVPLLWMLRYVR